MLNRSGESGHPCCHPALRGKDFSFLPLSMVLAVGLSHIAFITLRYVSYIPYFVEYFSRKRILNFVKCFFCISSDDMIFILRFVNVKYLD